MDNLPGERVLAIEGWRDRLVEVAGCAHEDVNGVVTRSALVNEFDIPDIVDVIPGCRLNSSATGNSVTKVVVIGEAFEVVQ